LTCDTTTVSTVKPVNSTPLNSAKPVNSNMSYGTGFAFPCEYVPLNSTSLQIALLFLRSQRQVLFAGIIVIIIVSMSIATQWNKDILRIRTPHLHPNYFSENNSPTDKSTLLK
jgi:hypothetical protein